MLYSKFNNCEPTHEAMELWSYPASGATKVNLVP